MLTSAESLMLNLLRRAGEHPASKTLLLLARITALPFEDVRRRCIFQGDRFRTFFFLHAFFRLLKSIESPKIPQR